MQFYQALYDMKGGTNNLKNTQCIQLKLHSKFLPRENPVFPVANKGLSSLSSAVSVATVLAWMKAIRESHLIGNRIMIECFISGWHR